jgi:two-component system, NarL family, response regulator LiaR
LRVLLIDSEELYLSGLEAFLSSCENIESETMLLGTGAPPEPGPGTFDTTLVGLSCGALVEELDFVRRLDARFGRKIALLSDACSEHMDTVLASGFDGLVHRSSPASALRRALERTAGGERFVDERVGSWLLSSRDSVWKRHGLTRRERDIADLMLRDMTAAEIASHLFISLNTVKFHVRNIYKKTAVTGRVQLHALASSHGRRRSDA